VTETIPAGMVRVRHVDGDEKLVREERTGQLSGRWSVVEEPAGEAQEAAPPNPPALGALKGDWARYALDRGATREGIEGQTKNWLIAHYGTEGQRASVVERLPDEVEPPAAAADEPDEAEAEAASGTDDTASEED
jgi:hypothetical protein